MQFIEIKLTLMILLVISVAATDGTKRKLYKKTLRFVDRAKMQRSFIAWPASHSIRLRCLATGVKPMKYRWLKDGQKMKPRQMDPYMNDTLWYFKLKDLVPSDDGKYTCIVSNKYGSINHTYTLHVVGKPRSPPILRPDFPRNTSVELGKDAAMRCIVVVSGTLPDFKWLKWHTIPKSYKNVNLSQHDKSLVTLISPVHYKTIKAGDYFGVQLTIKKVTKKDLGMYTCCASNHIGMRCNSAFLTEKVSTIPLTAKATRPMFEESIHPSNTSDNEIAFYAVGATLGAVLIGVVVFLVRRCIAEKQKPIVEHENEMVHLINNDIVNADHCLECNEPFQQVATVQLPHDNPQPTQV